MPRKVFQVQVELCIHAVTCPGVWLCPSGKLSLQIYMLDSCVQTSSVEPTFPLYFEEKFIFRKTFDRAQRLTDLQKLLSKECLYVELIQWTNCTIGNVLSTFISSSSEALFPAKCDGVYAGIDVDLLMEPSPIFPGIIAPKIEISTKTTVEERLCNPEQYKTCDAFVVNPTVTSNVKTRDACLHQKKVCHSVGYHKSRKYRCNLKLNEKPPFVYRKAEEQLLARKPKGFERSGSIICRCRGSRDDCRSFERPEAKMGDIKKRYGKSCCPITGRICICDGSESRCHSKQNCPVCAKYSSYFDKPQMLYCNPKISSVRVNKCKCISETDVTNEMYSTYKKDKTQSDFDANDVESDGSICGCCPNKRRNNSNMVDSAVITEINNTSSGESSKNSCSKFTTTNTCNCSNTKMYRTGQFQRRFYDSLEKFYDNLYKITLQQAKCRTSENLCIC